METLHWKLKHELFQKSTKRRKDHTQTQWREFWKTAAQMRQSPAQPRKETGNEILWPFGPKVNKLVGIKSLPGAWWWRQGTMKTWPWWNMQETHKSSGMFRSFRRSSSWNLEFQFIASWVLSKVLGHRGLWRFGFQSDRLSRIPLIYFCWSRRSSSRWGQFSFQKKQLVQCVNV